MLPGTLVVLLAGPVPSHADELSYVVQAGDNPWNLTTRFLKSLAYWPRLQRLNHIADARHIPPGTVLHVPIEWLRLESRSVEVVGLNGPVEVQADPPSMPVGPLLQTGMSLRAGMHITTGAESSVSLQFSDGSRILVLPDSELQIVRADTLAAGGGTILNLRLLHGGLENLVHPREGPGGRFEIETPAAVAGVRGTEFRLTAQGLRARTELLHGALALGNSLGQVVLEPGYGSVADAGAAPRPPIPLLPAPDLAGLPVQVERLPIDLAFPAVAGAVAYRTQLAADPAFASIAASAVSSVPHLRAADPPDGVQVFRVRAIDGEGLEGRASEVRLTIHARPQPPVLLEPAADALLADPRPTLRWAEHAGPARYLIQLTAGAEFGAPLLDATAEGSSLPLPQDLPPGSYQWRVATALLPNQPAGPFGDPSGFRIRAVPASPDLAPPEFGKGDVMFSWQRATLEGARYHLQLSAEPAFSRPVIDAAADEPRYRWDKPIPGIWYLRVNAVAADGFAGPWSAPQTVTVPEPDHGLRWPWLLLLLPVLHWW